MGRPTVTRKYPPHLLDVLDYLKADPTKPVILKYNVMSQARAFQMKFLSFRNAAVAEGWNIKPETDPFCFPDLNCYTTRVVDKKAHPIVVEVWHQAYMPENLSEVEQLKDQKR
jgi:hypothetical protein